MFNSVEHYSKRFYTLAGFRSDVREVVAHMDDLRRASRGGRVSKPFAEKIMLAVTRVNGCRYCLYGHSRAALASGVSEAELKQILAWEQDVFDDNEGVALTFAQHYAESGCQPDASAWQRLQDFYGEQTARDILAYLRMITLGNLAGNTLDAFLSRLKGKPAVESSFWGELSVLLGAFVVIPYEILAYGLARAFGTHRASS